MLRAAGVVWNVMAGGSPIASRAMEPCWLIFAKQVACKCKPPVMVKAMAVGWEARPVMISSSFLIQPALVFALRIAE